MLHLQIGWCALMLLSGLLCCNNSCRSCRYLKLTSFSPLPPRTASASCSTLPFSPQIQTNDVPCLREQLASVLACVSKALDEAHAHAWSVDMTAVLSNILDLCTQTGALVSNDKGDSCLQVRSTAAGVLC